MYKVIYKSSVIDVIDKPRYVRYIKQTGRVTICDKSSAHGLYSSDNKTVYMLQGKLNPEAENYRTVILQEITESEYLRIKLQLNKGETVCAYPQELENIRREKLDELSKKCNEIITSGLNVLMSDGLYHHFKLTLEDQLNIAMLEKQVSRGAKTVMYHETNKVSKMYRSEDIAKLFVEVDKHREYHTTYYNLLKYFINNCSDVNRIECIQYGVRLETLGLPKELLELVKER